MPAEQFTNFSSGVAGYTQTFLPGGAIAVQVLFRFMGYSIGPVGGAGVVFLQLHDKAVAIIAGDQPIIEIPAPAYSVVSLDFSNAPWPFLLGCTLAWSSTGAIYTPGPTGWFSGSALL